MEALVRFVADTLCEHPDAIEVRSGDDGLTLVVADDDLGRMIGRRGQTARALRTVLRAFDGPDLDITSPSERRDEADDGSADGDSDSG